MTKINDGGPAFPFDSTIPCSCGKSLERTGEFGRGMTLRDWFAGKALQGYMAGLLSNPETFIPDLKSDQMTKTVYVIADSMLKERGNDKV